MGPPGTYIYTSFVIGLLGALLVAFSWSSTALWSTIFTDGANNWISIESAENGCIENLSCSIVNDRTWKVEIKGHGTMIALWENVLEHERDLKDQKTFLGILWKTVRAFGDYMDNIRPQELMTAGWRGEYKHPFVDSQHPLNNTPATARDRLQETQTSPN